MRNALIQTRIEENVKVKAEKVFKAFGLTLNDGIRIFLNQTIIENGFPFKPSASRRPNAITRQAIKDVNEGRNVSSFTSVEDLFEDLDS